MVAILQVQSKSNSPDIYLCTHWAFRARTGRCDDYLSWLSQMGKNPVPVRRPFQLISGEFVGKHISSGETEPSGLTTFDLLPPLRATQNQWDEICQSQGNKKTMAELYKQLDSTIVHEVIDLIYGIYTCLHERR